MNAVDYQTPSRMALKRQAVPLPDMKGKRVLDVGCDMGAWCRLASDLGAVDVLGLDRNRAVRGQMVDLIAANRAQGIPGCRFERIEIGRQYHVLGHFDLVLCLSVYHHLFEAAGGDHAPIWYWLWRHCVSRSVLLWEGPVDTSDPVVRANVSHGNYTRVAILGAAAKYFTAEFVGPALHEPTREVWRFAPRAPRRITIDGRMVDGSGGATIAFNYSQGRRIGEIETAIGIRPVPGSLNVRLDADFDWESGYFRAQILDVADRDNGFDSPWVSRWARFYPLTIDGEDAFAFRFEGESYDPRFLELIASCVLREHVAGPRVVVRC